MDIFASIYSNPVYYLGVALALYGAIGVVYFIAGIFTGIHHAILLDGHTEHMGHYRHRVRRGIGIMLEALLIWEIIRLVNDWIMGNEVTNGGLVVWMLAVYVAVIIFGYLVPSSRPKDEH